MEAQKGFEAALKGALKMPHKLALMAIAALNVVLGVWRPRLTRRRAQQPAA